jgi:hypothetical protein
MQEAGVSLLTSWQTFYVLVGTAAATLMGLMFVVITLISGVRGRVSAPSEALWTAGLLLGLCGLWGGTYVVIVLRRVRRQSDYQPVLEDWLFHTILPLVSYTAFFVAAILLLILPALALFVIATAAVLLLFIGIHNAWDNVSYIVTELAPPENKREDQ